MQQVSLRPSTSSSHPCYYFFWSSFRQEKSATSDGSALWIKISQIYQKFWMYPQILSKCAYWCRPLPNQKLVKFLFFFVSILSGRIRNLGPVGNTFITGYTERDLLAEQGFFTYAHNANKLKPYWIKRNSSQHSRNSNRQCNRKRSYQYLGQQSKCLNTITRYYGFILFTVCISWFSTQKIYLCRQTEIKHLLHVISRFVVFCSQFLKKSHNF